MARLSVPHIAKKWTRLKNLWIWFVLYKCLVIANYKTAEIFVEKVDWRKQWQTKI